MTQAQDLEVTRGRAKDLLGGTLRSAPVIAMGMAGRHKRPDQGRGVCRLVTISMQLRKTSAELLV